LAKRPAAAWAASGAGASWIAYRCAVTFAAWLPGGLACPFASRWNQQRVRAERGKTASAARM
jgi:hypothetical protein